MNDQINQDAVSVAIGLGERSYDVLVGAGLIGEAGPRLRTLLSRPRAFVVSDETVAGRYGERLEASLRAAQLDMQMFTVAPGEPSKSFATLEELCRRLLEAGLERRDMLIALGGGVVGDLAGFAASILLRGVDYVQIPTTLLAQVDSSVGGKTGINVPEGKNLIGSFHQPRLVLADTAALDTLPRRELLAGYAEVAKYGLLGDAGFFAWLEENGDRMLDGDAEARRHAIETSVRAKASIVARDERESGVRALLNLGHTFGHALEASASYDETLLHGEAVAIGIVLAFELSARLGACSVEDAARVRRHFEGVGLPTAIPDTLRAGGAAELLDHVRHDKKVADGKLTFVLAKGIGDAFLARDVDPAEVRAVLDTALAA